MTLNYYGFGKGGSKVRLAVAVALLMTVAAILVVGPIARTRFTSHVEFPAFTESAAAASTQPVHLAYGHMPLAFEANQGQTDSQVKFMARGHGYGLFLTQQEVVLSLRSSVVGRQSSAAVLRMALANANPDAAVSGADLLPGKSNYFIGNNPAKWHRDVPEFARVRYAGVYPGIDLIYYGNQGSLEYDFEVAPQANPQQIALSFRGNDKLALSDGDLVLSTQGGDVRLKAPTVYQRFGDEQRAVPARFVLLASDRVGFELGDYDRSKTLVIDPVLSYSSYLGGSVDEACSILTGSVQSGCPGIAVDQAFNIYVAGTTNSANFPVVGGTGGPSGPTDAFVIKFDPTGLIPLFSTYLGGGGTEVSGGVAVDGASKVYIAGTTDSSTDFPTSIGTAFQSPPVSAGNHVFMTQFDSTGTMGYSTLLASTGTDSASGIALDFKSKVHVMGTTNCPTAPTTSCNFPVTTASIQTTPRAINQFFYSKIDPTLPGVASLVYSTYLGGSIPSTGVAQNGGVAVDQNTGSPGVYLTGTTDFTDMPVLNAVQGTPGGLTDAFAAKITFNANNTSPPVMTYLTYLGGSANDLGNGIGADSTGNAYIVGTSSSTDFFTKYTITSGLISLQPCLDSPGSVPPCPVASQPDAFLVKIGSAPSTGQTIYPVTYDTYLGGSAAESGLAVAVDSLLGAHITGTTNSPDFPVLGTAVQGGPAGGVDAFVARVDTTANSTTANGHFSTYLGGGANDAGTGIAVDPLFTTYVAGETLSGNFPTATPFQSGLSGTSDAFFAKLGPAVNLGLAVTTTPIFPAPGGVGTAVSFTYTISNPGDLTTGIIFTDTLPVTGATFSSATTSQGLCGAATGSPATVTCTIGTMNGGGTATVTINVVPTVAGTLSNSGRVTLTTGSSFTVSASASVTVNDFAVNPTQASVTVQAGQTASFNVDLDTVPANQAFPNEITMSVSGLPSATTATWTTNPVLNLNSGSASTTLNLATTMRPVPVGTLGSSGLLRYATWLPVSGLLIVGMGFGGKFSRRRKLLAGLLVLAVLSLIGLQAACSNNSTSIVTTGGTPAGTYTITVTGTSGSIPHSKTTTLVVQ